jgi:thiamine biosynthesis protein ThiS
MNILLNGTREELPDGTTLKGLIDRYRLKKKSVVVELNRKVVDRSTLESTEVHENDTIEIVHFVGGG